MVYYGSAGGKNYASSTGYLMNSGSYSSVSSMYSVKKNPLCCGSFSRGQRCVGCPNS